MASSNARQAGRDAADFDNRRKEDPTWADRFREVAREELPPHIAGVVAQAEEQMARFMEGARAYERAAALAPAREDRRAA